MFNPKLLIPNKLNPTNDPDLPRDFDSLESLYDYLVADYHAQLCEENK